MRNTSVRSSICENQANALGTWLATSRMHHARFLPSLSTGQILLSGELEASEHCSELRNCASASEGSCIPSLTLGGHCGGKYERYLPKRTTNEKDVTPMTPAL